MNACKLQEGPHLSAHFISTASSDSLSTNIISESEDFTRHYNNCVVSFHFSSALKK